MQMGMKRSSSSNIDLTEQVWLPSKRFIIIVKDCSLQASIPGGVFWFGTQMDYSGKFMPASAKDGADPRKKVSVK
jgi:hypothetical protein